MAMNPLNGRPRVGGADRGTSARSGNRKSRRIIIPFLFLAVFALIVLYNAVPSLRLKIEALLFPEAFRATEACRQTALASASTPGFARLLAYGEAHEVSEGYYVDRVVIGEMGPNGAEQRFEVSCYINSAGRIIKSHRHLESKSITAVEKESDPVGNKLKR
jgi:hypothetical protein